MKYLIVNGDDFGASRGINLGVIEAHRHGILTSTSLLVNTPWSQEAAALSGAAPKLSVGLHLDLRNDDRAAGSFRGFPKELREQFTRFCELMGRLPTHLDSHHNIHRDPQVLPYFLELAHEHGLPLREHSPARYFSKFYGQWGRQTHLEQVSVASLVRMLETEIPDGLTELSCHPGYRDPEFSSGYSVEREAELRTLCDPAIRQAIGRQSIQLISYHDLSKLAESRAAEGEG
jgi:predicted glycoside hydrolase/deacetylase ChbG (UPF0249 family)